MKPDDILIALQELTQRERIEFLAPAPDARKPSPYAPIEKYLLDLKNNAKPESAAEDPPVQPSGFDGIIGNPPWEGFKPFRKEFW